MPGPAPKDPASRRRRNAAVGKTVLPSGGRVGEAPAWPLRRSEPDVWVELWATPQAAAWERLGWTRVVARYAVLIELIEDDEGTPSGTILGEIRQMEDRLGLNPKAMRSLLWEVADDDAVTEKRESKKTPARASSKRASLKIVG